MESRLAAILVVEVATGGDPAAGGDDATARASALRTIAYGLVDPTIARFRGRILSVAVQRTVAEFGDLADALACALEIQRGMAEGSTVPSEADAVDLRLGLDLAEIVLDRGDVVDQALVVARRLAALAPPGAIAASGTLVRRIDRRSFRAEFAPRGIDRELGRPVEVVAIHPLTRANAQSPWIVRRRWTVTAAVAAVLVLSIATAVLWRPVLQRLLGLAVAPPQVPSADPSVDADAIDPDQR